MADQAYACPTYLNYFRAFDLEIFINNIFLVFVSLRLYNILNKTLYKKYIISLSKNNMFTEA